MKSIFTLIFLSALTVGCTPSKSIQLDLVDRSSLNQSQAKNVITLPALLVALDAPSNSEVGLLPGNYRSTYEDPFGTYYLGEGRALYVRFNGKYAMKIGGIWVPHEGQPKIFHFTRTADLFCDTLPTGPVQPDPSPSSQGGGASVACAPLKSDSFGWGVDMLVHMEQQSIPEKLWLFMPLNKNGFSEKLLKATTENLRKQESN